MRTADVPRLALALALMLVTPVACSAYDLFGNDFQTDIVGSGLPVGFYDFEGSSQQNGDEQQPSGLMRTLEITAAGGAGGTQGFSVDVDASGVGPDSNGWTYWWNGYGSYGVEADDSNPLASGAAGTNDPAMFRFSADIKVTGNSSSTPLEISVTGYDDNYDTVYGIDGNGDGEVNGADRYAVTYTPTLVNGADYAHVSFTLDQGTISADDNVTTPEWGADLAILYQFAFNSGGFGTDANNSFSVDNVLFEFLGEVPVVPGDYNDDGVTDAADYTVWRDNLGATGTPGEVIGDGTGSDLAGTPDGVVDSYDYDYWKANYAASSGTGAVALNAVPEPCGLVLALTAALALAAARPWRG